MTNRNNRIRRKPNTAELLSRQLASTSRKEPGPITDNFAKGVARRLESRRIAMVPGLRENDTAPSWYDRAIEHDRNHGKFEAQRKVQRLAAEEAQLPTAAMLESEISGRTGNPPQRNASPLPLNGAAVLRAALAGGHGTIGGRDTGDPAARGRAEG